MNKTAKYLIAIGITLVLTVLSVSTVDAQCAMCRAVAENSLNDDGYGTAAGLNNGIMFLMGIPYILLATLFLVFFRKQLGGFFRSFNNIH
jgi:hypothetical protein